MSLRRRVLGGSGVLLGGQVTGQALSFVRNVILARLISQEDFGIATTIALMLNVFETISNLSVDRLLVQAKDGDEAEFQATAQSLQALRGVGLAVCIYLTAWPCAQLFGTPQALWAFQCVALVPLMRGFAHLDPKRLNREFKFGPDVASELIPQVLILAAAWPFARHFGNYSAMLWLVLIQAATAVLVTHAVAKRRYRWAWNRSVRTRMLEFGWPLMLNGLLMYVILQGDRIVIGSAYDMKQMAIYSVAFSITWLPSLMLAKVGTAVLLPLLSSAQNDIKRFTYLYSISVQVLCLLCTATATVFILLGQRIVEITYGPSYASVGPFIGWLAIMQMVRVVRAAPTIAAMAFGDTITLLASNVIRVSFFPLVIFFAVLGKPLAWVAAIGCVGEIITLMSVLRRMQKRHGLAAGLGLKPALVTAISVAAAMAIASFGGQSTWWSSILGITVVILSTLGAMAWLFPDFRRAVISSV